MPLCPKCGHEIAKTDTHCMDCGADLIAERDKERKVLREMSMAARMGSGQTVVTGAAAGTMAVGEKSAEETRIRAFDRQEAERMAQERTTAWVTAGIALVLGIAFAAVGYARLKSGGGFQEVPDLLKPKSLRDLGIFATAAMQGFLMMGMGLSGILIAFGQIRLAMATTNAIRQVRQNVRPDIVQVSRATQFGFLVLCVFCPPLGLIIGLVLKFGRNPDLRGLGGTMALVSIAVMVILGGNLLLGLASHYKPAKAK
jgi:hypothetical protein